MIEMLRKIAIVLSMLFFIALQGCSTVMIPEEDPRPSFNAELAKEYRENIAEIDRHDRKNAHEERISKAKADAIRLKAQTPSTTIIQQPAK